MAGHDAEFDHEVRRTRRDGADPRDDDIRVTADVDDGTLEIVVVDHGVGLRADARDRGLGAGLKIIAECADAFAIRERVPDGVEVPETAGRELGGCPVIHRARRLRPATRASRAAPT